MFDVQGYLAPDLVGLPSCKEILASNRRPVLQTDGDINRTFTWGSPSIYALQIGKERYCAISLLRLGHKYPDTGDWQPCLPWGTGQLKWTELETWNECWHGKWVKMSNFLIHEPRGLCSVIPWGSSCGPKWILFLPLLSLDGVSPIHIFSALILSLHSHNSSWHLYVLFEQTTHTNCLTTRKLCDPCSITFIKKLWSTKYPTP